MRFVLIIVVFASTLYSCSEKDGTLFNFIPPETSGIDFNNIVIGNDSLNVMDYDYFYNGGGVGIGDFNLDGLPDIFFSGNMTSSKLYLNKGNLKFEDITESAGISTDDWCTGVSIIDINQDGRPDIHVATGSNTDKASQGNYFFINVTTGDDGVRFEEKSLEMGLKDSIYAMQAAWLDYDKDNDLDLFIIHNALEDYQKNIPLGQRKDGSGKSTDKLYRNEGLQNGLPYFTDVSREAGILIEGWSLGVAVSDFNGDNFPDLYVANDFLSNDILYINNTDGTFSNKIGSYIRHQSHNSMGIDVADLNNDAAPDIVVLDMLPEDNLRHKTMFPDIAFNNSKNVLSKGYQQQYVRNVLQLNNGNRTFSEIGYLAGISATDWSWSPLIADFDNDGHRDLYVTNGYVKEITDLDFVDNYNKGSIFGTKETKRKKLVEQLNAMKGVKKSNRFFRNSGELIFIDKTELSGLQRPSFSNGAVYADLDVDGDLDIIVNNINDPAFVFENTTIQKEKIRNNFLKLRFTPQHRALGAKIYLYANGERQFSEYYPSRGYLSSVGPAVHFGLKNAGKVDSLKIMWPTDSLSVLKDVQVNQELLIPVGHMPKRETSRVNPLTETVFHRVPVNGISYVHKENGFNDFDHWPLHFRSYDKLGPAITTGDINGDYMDDIIVGGAAGESGRIYFGDESGNFTESKSFDEINKEFEDTELVLFDADGDGDLDLYCASGTSEHFSRADLLQDRFYFNDGRGAFKYRKSALPKIKEITATVAPLDYDRDGDLDLFIGGRVRPNAYPESPRSYLLQNDGKGNFKDVTKSHSRELLYPGMVTSAAIADIDKDGWDDLVLVGEWMPIDMYYNKKGVLKKQKGPNGLEASNGWWNCIAVADLDNDGDLDFLLGNWGLNNPFKANRKEPLRIYAKDYDNNGTIEAIMTYYNQGEEYIVHPRNTLTKQLPVLRQRVKDYKTYGETPFHGIFGKADIKGAKVWEAMELASGFIENLGGCQFRFHAFPIEAQWAPILDFEITDLNKDVFPDVLGVGNFYGTEVLTGNYDAGNGICMLGQKNGGFKVVRMSESGFYFGGEARKIDILNNVHGKRIPKRFIIVSQNDSLQFLENSGGFNFIDPNPTD
ncbi:VCBS repeat-containing protein [Ulvibacterium marinum]|uniref:RNA-binding protein n=1 Tax=Ulvibacterium marinum TaxID=2419782 RepID=A0A3B0BZT9_9FLAO|nr:VCBS repeat-containing protein [Ulvibacterium marinum]RKN77961.1 RNA-binding protein [Ulvibacterium marinum]